MHDVRDFLTFKKVLHVKETYRSSTTYWDLDELMKLLQEFKTPDMIQAHMSLEHERWGGYEGCLYHLEVTGYRPATDDEKKEYRRLLREEKAQLVLNRRANAQRLAEQLAQIDPKLVNPDWETLI